MSGVKLVIKAQAPASGVASSSGRRAHSGADGICDGERQVESRAEAVSACLLLDQARLKGRQRARGTASSGASSDFEKERQIPLLQRFQGRRRRHPPVCGTWLPPSFVSDRMTESSVVGANLTGGESMRSSSRQMSEPSAEAG